MLAKLTSAFGFAVLALAGCAHSSMPATPQPQPLSNARLMPDIWQRGPTPEHWTKLSYAFGFDPPLVYSWPIDDNGVIAFGTTCCSDDGGPPQGAIEGVNYSGTRVPLTNVNPPEHRIPDATMSSPIKPFRCANGTQICAAGGTYYIYGPSGSAYYTENYKPYDAVADTGDAIWFTINPRYNFTGLSHIVRGLGPTQHYYNLNAPADRVYDIVRSNDGNLWVLLQKQGTSYWIFGKFVPATAVLTEYPLRLTSLPKQLLLGSDGNVWFALGQTLYRLVPSNAQVTRFAMPKPVNGYLTNGPRGTIWLGYVQSIDAQGLIEANTSGAVIATSACPYCTAPTSTDFPENTIQQLTLGPDGNIWFAYSNPNLFDANHISNPAEGLGVYIYYSMHVTPESITLAAGRTADITFSEDNYSGTFTAASTTPSVANVVRFVTPHEVQIQALKSGTARIIIRDSMNNYYGVTVTVQ